MYLIGDQGRQPSGEERRQSPRVQIMENLQGRQIARDVPVSMLEVGLGGFSLETPLPFPVGGVQEFLVTLTDGTSLTIRGRVAHCRQEVGGETRGQAGEVRRQTDDGQAGVKACG